MDKPYLRAALVLLLAPLLAACGPKLIRGESPMVRITELSHQDDVINLQLSFRNVNDETLDIMELDFDLSSDEKTLLAHSGPAAINITAKGTETWFVDAAESDTAKHSLDALESGEIKSLPYSLQGSIMAREAGKLRFEYQGHLYPLPGRPGHFR